MNRRSFLARIAGAVAGAVVAGVVKVLPIGETPRRRVPRSREMALELLAFARTPNRWAIVTDVNAEAGVITFASLDDIKLHEQAHADWEGWMS